jgi:hypothetical protein
MRLAVGVPGVGSTGSRIASAPLGGVGLYARRIIFIQTDRLVRRRVRENNAPAPLPRRCAALIHPIRLDRRAPCHRTALPPQRLVHK